MKHAVAILSYVNRPELDPRLITTLRTLRDTYHGKVFLVDDGSTVRNWDVILPLCDGYNVQVFVKTKNSGISKGKNTCIRLLMEYGIDVGFLVDDDIGFQTGWLEKYLEAHEKTDIQHFSWASQKSSLTRTYQGFRLRVPNHLNGLLMTFTPEVIEKVGGFEVTELKWGWDHVNWTNRIVEEGLAPFYADILNSHNYIGINQHGGQSSVSLGQRREGKKFNFPKIGSVYRPLEE